MEVTLLESLLSAAGEGKRADGGFKREAWEKVLQAMREKYPLQEFELRQLKNKINYFKMKYCTLKQCFGASGFGRSPESNIPTADDEV
jgi:hypothetical protein